MLFVVNMDIFHTFGTIAFVLVVVDIWVMKIQLGQVLKAVEGCRVRFVDRDRR